MLNATVIEKVSVADGLIKLLVKPDVAPKAFSAGQYVALGLEAEAGSSKLTQRAYSLCSGADTPEVLEFFLSVYPDGELSGRLASLKVGDRIHATAKPVGTFTLARVPEGVNLVFVATGTGLAPFISMLRSKATFMPERKVTLVHGVRYARELGYFDELSTLAKARADFTYIPTISRDDAGWTGQRGRVQVVFESDLVRLDPVRDHIFLCGNQEMLDNMQRLFIARGYSLHTSKTPGNLHIERFW